MHSYAASFALLSALMFYTLNVMAKTTSVYVDQVTCDDDASHCVYLKNAFTYGEKDDKPVACTKRTKQGHGSGTCQFPDNSTTTVQCKYGNATVFYVDFSKTSSTFKYANGNYSTTYGDEGTAIWSSEKARTNGVSGDASTSEAGDDLYVNCPSKA